MNQPDVIFPHLGIKIETLHNHLNIFGFRVAFYGMIIGLGMLAGLWLASRDYKRRGRNPEIITDFALVAIISAIVGARAYYVAFEWSYYSAHPEEILNIRGGGLAIYGSVIAAAICCLIFSRVRKLSFFDLADSCVIGLIAGQAIGRWGNFFNAEAFGAFTNGPFAMQLKESIVNSAWINEQLRAHMVIQNGVNYIQVHPTFLYESCWNVLVLLSLLWTARHKRFEGQVFYQYLLGYGLGRCIIEGLRTDSLYLWGTGIRVSQALSGVLVVFALGMTLYHLCRRGQRESV